MTFFLVVLLLLLTGFYHGGEIIYRTSNKLSIEILKSKRPKIAQILSNLYDYPVFFLITMLVGSLFFLALYVAIFNGVLFPFLDDLLPINPILSQLIAIWIMATIMIVFGQYLPKILFGSYANELMMRLAIPLYISKWLFSIPGWILMKTSEGLSRLFYGKAQINTDGHFTKDDLESYIQTNIHEEKDIDKEILNNALNLNLLRVRDCMIPRNEIVFVDKSDSVKEIKQTFLKSRHSRLIVVDGDLEHIEGYIHHQQLFDPIKTVKGILMPIDIVPEVMNVQDLMYKFIKQGTNIACVVDEFGGISGLITLEDILEEIFGEIADEHDDESYKEEQINENEFVFSGRLELAYLNGKYPQFDFPEEEYTTLSGYIVMTLGSIPEIEEEIELDGYVFKVIDRSETKIEVVNVKIKHTDEGHNEG
jgi:putative hemolysin